MALLHDYRSSGKIYSASEFIACNIRQADSSTNVKIKSFVVLKLYKALIVKSE